MDALNIRNNNADIYKGAGLNSQTGRVDVQKNQATRNVQAQGTQGVSVNQGTQGVSVNQGTQGVSGVQGGQNTQTGTLTNVVSTSQDGDTLQVNQSQMTSGRDGSVTTRNGANKPNSPAEILREQTKAAEQKKQDLKKADEAKQKKQDIADQAQKITNFNSYTDSQMEQLYLQGRISKSDYDKEMASREQDNADQQQSSAALSRTQARLNGTLTRADMEARAINTAYSDTANNSVMTANERISAMQKVQNNQTQERQTQTNMAQNEGRRTWDYQLRA